MWLQVKESARDWFATESLRDAEGTLGHEIEFTANYKANVPDDVGEQAIDYYPFLEPSGSDSAEDEDAESDSETTTDDN